MLQSNFEMEKKHYPETVLFDDDLSVNDSAVLTYIQDKVIDSRHINYLKKMSGFTDDILSEWLDVSVKTLRSYKTSNSHLKENIRERVILLISLMNHGIRVFGSNVKFDQWLNANNYFLDAKTPASFLKTITGIRFIDDRLTAMELGDNI